MSATYTILFLGDIVGEPGRTAVQEGLPSLQNTFRPLFTIANGENAAAGIGITPKIADQFLSWGIDVITLGNHAFNKRDIFPYLDASARIIRPINMPSTVPGKGVTTFEREGVKLMVANVCGRTFMDNYDDPFRAADALMAEKGDAHLFIDFHAEATSEKIAFGWHVAGKATAVVGTHTHVTTADETILPGGTAYITDVGMCGPIHSVLGMDRHIVLDKFRKTLPTRFQVANEPGVISAVAIDVQRDTGHAVSIERIRFGDHS